MSKKSPAVPSSTHIRGVSDKFQDTLVDCLVLWQELTVDNVIKGNCFGVVDDMKKGVAMELRRILEKSRSAGKCGRGGGESALDFKGITLKAETLV